MIRLDPEPAKRLREWLDEEEDGEGAGGEDADQPDEPEGEDADQPEDEPEGEDADQPEDEPEDEETTSEYVQRIVREYSRLGFRSDESERRK